jgi:hypothetical protein
MNHETHLVPMERPANKTDILWQVHEWLFPRSPNLYAAVNPLIAEISSLLKHPDVPEDEKWLFRPKDGQQPNVKFLLYENIIHNRQTTALVYDQAFSIRVFTVDQNVVALPMGHIDDSIYYAYWTVKRPGKDIPPLPKDTVSGYLEPAGKGFALESIFLNGWDCRPEFEASQLFSGLTTKDYNDIASLPLLGPDYGKAEIEEILARHKDLPDVKKLRERMIAHFSPKWLEDRNR